MQTDHKNPVVLEKALVVCIGNELVADDAVGAEIYQNLNKTCLPENVRLMFCGVGGVALLDMLEGDENMMIVVDAVQFGAKPGTIHRYEWDEMPGRASGAISAHGIGQKDEVDIGKILFPERMPEKIILIGIEGICFNLMRDSMTREVAEAVESAVELISNELKNWNDRRG